MQQYRNIQQTAEGRDLTDTFYGYDHRLKLQPGLFYDMENISCRDFPLLATRKKRGTVAPVSGSPQGVIYKASPIHVAGTHVFLNLGDTGLMVSEPSITFADEAPSVAETGSFWYDTITGITYERLASSWLETSYPGKQLVSMGAYLLIFPEKVWLNTQDGTYGYMESNSTIAGSITYEPSTMDGVSITDTNAGDEPPNGGDENTPPANGTWWLDTSGEEAVLRQYSVANGGWQEMQSSYIKITLPGGLTGFEKGDAVDIVSGIDAANGSRIITDISSETVDGDTVTHILIPGTIPALVTHSGAFSISRTLPDMDYVCEAENRLWGCKYGVVDGEPINELYCSALGDFKNWRKYEGLSTDSWAASCGTDGKWTGCINYFGHPTFFKRDHIHVITISPTGAHSVKDYAFEGVQSGSWRSLAVVGNTLYYKSDNHICAYQGGIPAVVSDALGDQAYVEATGGALGKYYYVSMRKPEGGWNVFVLDTGSGRWYREDDTHFVGFSAGDGDLYGLSIYDDGLPAGKLVTMAGTVGTRGGQVDWMAQTGILYWQSPDNKYTHRYNVRVKMSPGSRIQLWLRYNSEGDFEAVSPLIETDLGKTGTYTIPVRPHRCDHMELKITGRGDVKIYSIARIYQEGSDVNA